jgi:hypothetical protein
MSAQHIQYRVLLTTWACWVGMGIAEIASAQDFASRGDQLQTQQKHVVRKPSSSANALTSVPVVGSEIASEAKSVPAPVGAKGPYYVDFRARTAATYGHAFVWYGKTRDKAVEVAGLHPAGDVLPYVLGHLMFVPSETGASYGDLDVQYLTASYRVYLSEPDAKKVFGFIKDIQAHSPLWNAETYNCTAFIGRIATFMGLKVPFHLQVPEDYVNNLRRLNGNRQNAQLVAN